MKNQLPKRRGIVLRSTPNGMALADSYGQQYIRVKGGIRKLVQAPVVSDPLVLGGFEL